MHVPPVENTTCAAFEEYDEVPEMVNLEFLEDVVVWAEYKLSGAAGALGAEAIELRNWLLFFGCVLEDFRVVVADLVNWMANSSPPTDDYHDIMACGLIVLYKRPEVRPVWIGKTICQAIAKLVMRAAGYQAKTACV